MYFKEVAIDRWKKVICRVDFISQQKGPPKRNKNVYFNIIAPIGSILKIEDHFPKQFGVEIPNLLSIFI